MQRIQLSETSGVPVFRQIIDQVVFMIEAGELQDGDRLPAGRMLAANLDVNRNTTARAYAELARMGYVTSQGRAGMIVTRSAEARDTLAKHEQAVSLLAGPVRECLALGLTADEIRQVAYHESLSAQQAEIRICFVECGEERAKAFAAELSETVSANIVPLVIDAIGRSDLDGADLVVTTFFHHAEIRRLVSSFDLVPAPEVLAIVAAPHLKTLSKLASIPKSRRIGILYSTPQQAEEIRQSLTDSGLTNVSVLSDAEDDTLGDFDLVVVPSEDPSIKKLIEDRVSVLEFGNVLDAASRRIVSEFVDEIRERRARD